jgi:hypothetical protein
MKMKRFYGLFVVVFISGFLWGCTAKNSGSRTSEPFTKGPDGNVVWESEYHFIPPPAPWTLVQLDENDYSLAYMLTGQGTFPFQTTIAYAEEPFGYSLAFKQRAREFYRRFLWASRVTFGPLEEQPTTVFGEDGLDVTATGEDPVRGHKVWTRVIFAHRGERVVAFYMTQWRPRNQPFDLAEVKVFERFVRSFGFLKKSFFQELQAEN